MNKHYGFDLKKFISLVAILMTTNCVLGIAPLNILPTLSQPVFAQEDPLAKGMKKLEQGGYHEAIAAFTEAVRLYPNLPQPYVGRASSYLLLEKPQQALEDCNQAVHLDPSNIDLYSLRGFVYIMLLNPQKALEDFNQVIRLDPSSGDGYAGRGIAYGILSNQKKATEDIQKAMTIYEQQGKTEEIKKFKENFSQFLEI